MITIFHFLFFALVTFGIASVEIHTMQQEIIDFFTKDNFQHPVFKYYPVAQLSDAQADFQKRSLGIGPFFVRCMKNPSPIDIFAVGCYESANNLKRLADNAEIKKTNADDDMKAYVAWGQEQLINAPNEWNCPGWPLKAHPIVLFFMGIIDRRTADIIEYQSIIKDNKNFLNQTTLIDERSNHFKTIFNKIFQQNTSEINALFNYRFTTQEQAAYTLLESLYSCNYNTIDVFSLHLAILYKRLQLMRNTLKITS